MEFLVVGKNNTVEDLQSETGVMKGVSNYKYLVILFNKLGTIEEELTRSMNLGGNVIRTINSMLWNKNIRIATKKRSYRSIIQTGTTHGSEAWKLTKKLKQSLLTLEMELLAQNKQNKEPQNEKKSHGIENKRLEETEKKQLIRFGHVMRMSDER